MTKPNRGRFAGILFTENDDRIPVPWRNDIERGIQQGLDGTADGWKITHREPADRTCYVIHFEAGGRDLGTLTLNAEEVHLTAGPGPESAKVQAVVREAVKRFVEGRL